MAGSWLPPGCFRHCWRWDRELQDLHLKHSSVRPTDHLDVHLVKSRAWEKKVIPCRKSWNADSGNLDVPTSGKHDGGHDYLQHSGMEDPDFGHQNLIRLSQKCDSR